MKVSRQTSSINQKHSQKQGQNQPDSGRTDDPLLPHESDQAPHSQEEAEPRHVGKQGYHDVEHGLEDTDRRGGDDYQRRTQSDDNVNSNSTQEGKK